MKLELKTLLDTIHRLQPARNTEVAELGVLTSSCGRIPVDRFNIGKGVVTISSDGIFTTLAFEEIVGFKVKAKNSTTDYESLPKGFR